MDEQSPHPSDDSAPTDAGTPRDPGGEGAHAKTDDTATDKKPDIAPEFELVTLEHRGLKWDVPKARGQWDMNVQFEFEEGNRLRGFCVLLGGSPANIAAVRNQIYRVCRTADEVDALLDDVAEQANKLCTG